MAFDTGIPKLERLLLDPKEPPLAKGMTDPAVGVFHDLLNRFDPTLAQLRPKLSKGWKKAKPPPLPSLDIYQDFSAKTEALISAFQSLRGLDVNGTIDNKTALALVLAENNKKLITPAELIFGHGLKLSHTLTAVILTGGKECRFDFTVMNRNGDGAGLSLGVLHWAQRPGRLAELIVFLRDRSPVAGGIKAVDTLFGGTKQLDTVIAHLKLGAKGLKADGKSVDPKLEFAVPDPKVPPNWLDCFRSLVALPFAQAAMIEMATKTFRKLYDDAYADYPGDPKNLVGRDLKVYAPKLKSQRAVVFALDMINQHGGHVRDYYKECMKDHPNADEKAILTYLTERAAKFWLEQKKEKSEEKRKKNAAADTARRNFFINTKNLSSEIDFDPT
jgi:hypothetical protein